MKQCQCEARMAGECACGAWDEVDDDALAAMTAERDQLLQFVRSVPAYTKHGPDGSGGVGACESTCIKCRAESLLRKLAEGTP